MDKTLLCLDRGSYAPLIDLNSMEVPGIRLRRDGWRPQVSSFNDSSLGRFYLDVAETIPLRATGLTEAEARYQLRLLIEAMYQVYRWRNFENIDPVILRCKLSESDLPEPYLQAAVIREPDNPQGLLGLPANYTRKNQVVIDFDLPLIRHGDWLGIAEVQNGTFSTLNPAILALSSAYDNKTKLPSPHEVAIEWDDHTHTGNDGFLAFAPASDWLFLIEAETAIKTATGGSGTFDAVSESNASGGQIRRLVPDTATTYRLNWELTNYASEPTLAWLFISLKNRSTTISYTISASVSRSDSAPGPTAAVHVVGTSDNDEHIVKLGPLSARDGFTDKNIHLVIVPSATGVAGDSLDIDVALVASGQIVAFQNVISDGDFTIEAQFLTVDDLSLVDPTPGVYWDITGASPERVFVDYSGNPAVYLDAKSPAVAIIGQSDGYWVFMDSAESNKLNVRANITRRQAYLVPR